jgi:NADPH:quinone reductase-like Zn-dependent oxidoreductase
VLRKGGCVVSIKGRDTKNLAKQYGVRFEGFLMWPSGEMLSTLARMIDEGAVRPIIDRRFSFEQTALAYDYLQSGRAKGKIVIQIK